MKTRKILLAFSIILIAILTSCASQSTLVDPSMRRVRYVSGIIHSVNRNVVELSDGSIWRLNRFLITTNMSEAFVVLYDDRSQGFMYVNGVKYLLDPQTPGIGLVTDTNSDLLSRKNIGYLSIIKNIDMNVGTITLLGDTEWRISGYYEDVVKEWRAGTDLIITDDLSWAINPRTFSKAEVKLLTSRK